MTHGDLFSLPGIHGGTINRTACKLQMGDFYFSGEGKEVPPQRHSDGLQEKSPRRPHGDGLPISKDRGFDPKLVCLFIAETGINFI